MYKKIFFEQTKNKLKHKTTQFSFSLAILVFFSYVRNYLF